MSVPRRGFDLDLRFGEAGETALVHLFLRSRVEVKSDREAVLTRNVFVELQAKSRLTKEWMSSGLTTTEAHWWAFQIVGLDRWVIISTSALRDLVERRLREENGRTVLGGDVIDGAKGFRGVLIPTQWLVGKL